MNETPTLFSLTNNNSNKLIKIMRKRFYNIKSDYIFRMQQYFMTLVQYTFLVLSPITLLSVP